MREVIAAARLSGPILVEQGKTTWEYRFDAAAPFFAGHFPGHPILPGVFQLEMARAAAELQVRRPLVIRVIHKAKFTKPIQPDETIRVVLKVVEETAGCFAQARFFVGAQPVGETQLGLGTP